MKIREIHAYVHDLPDDSGLGVVPDKDMFGDPVASF